MITQKTGRSFVSQFFSYFWIAIGSFLAAFAIDVFLIPNQLIDGGVIGIAMILSNIYGKELLPYFLSVFTIPFLVLAYRFIGRVFVIHMFFAIAFFVSSIFLVQWLEHAGFLHAFIGESLEVVVIGGIILGIGTGMVIRYGGCLDGTEILGIIINRKTGITVGQVVLFFNVFVFSTAGIVFKDWHPPLLSLITFMVATKVMDAVIVGLEETKSVMIISEKSKAVADAIIHEMGLGLTYLFGRGGYSGENREILYVIAERLQLSELKELIHREDPKAFIAIENLHEVTTGLEGQSYVGKKKKIEKLMTRILNPKK